MLCIFRLCKGVFRHGHIRVIFLRNVLCGTSAEHKCLQQGIGCKAVVAVNARAGAFTHGIEPLNVGAGTGINGYAPHEVVLAGVDGDKVMPHVYALCQQEFKYHGEALMQELLPHVAYVKEEFVTACALAFKHDGA